MREHYTCHQQCDIGFCPSACGQEGFCYYTIPGNETDSETEGEEISLQELVPESLKKQSLIINTKNILASESKCFKPGLILEKSLKTW